MPGRYDPVLAKTDPLMPVHAKLPRSTIRTLQRAAAKRDRNAVYIIREVMMEWAQEWREKNREVNVDEDFEYAHSRKPGKKRKIG